MATITKAHLAEHIVRLRDYLAESQTFCRDRGWPVVVTFNVATIAMSLRNNNYGLAKRIAVELVARGHAIRDPHGQYTWTEPGE